jgi:PAS domain S-box-containing protein
VLSSSKASLEDQQYFKALTEASIVSKSDTDGNIIYVNDNFCKITGYSREEMIGRNHNMFRHPGNTDETYKNMWDTIKSGKVWRDRIKNLNKDGSTFIADSTIIPLMDEDGVIKEYMAIRNDITDMVKLKREIFEKEQEKLKQEKVKEAQKAFLVVFTHELKTPLNAIINFSKYIKKQMTSPKELDRDKLTKLLDSILNNSQDMLENVTQILEVSKLNSHKLTYTYSIFSANEIVSDVIKKHESLLREKNIHLTLNIDDEVLINSDIQRVKQILSNIVSNAIKYGHNEIIITISNNEYATISVEDNGKGIKDKEAIFNLYAQEDDDLLERKGQGTGVGLYFMKLLCRDLSIDYKVEDVDGSSGTKFTIMFKR